MPTIDPRASEKFQQELLSGESILWAGIPNPSVIFHWEDWAMVPFSLLWGGGALFMGAESFGWWRGKPGTAPTWDFGMIVIAAFIAIGQYLIWGRFVMDGWLKRRTYYGITNRRSLFLQQSYERKSRVVYLDTLSEIEHEGSTTGRIWLGPRGPMVGGRSQSRSLSAVNISGAVPVLTDIDDVEAVYHLILDLRQKMTPSKREF